MTKKEVEQLKHGLYEIEWSDEGTSFASVGSDTSGRRWFAPTNWIEVPNFNWRLVKSVRLLCPRKPSIADLAATYSDPSKNATESK